MRYCARIAYDGTRFAGFQFQRNASPTVQETLEQALEAISGEPHRVIGAGRTDAGVHALGQVVAFDLAWVHPVDALQRALNARLPDDLVVLALAEAEATFHPRFDARSRRYRYRLCVSEWPDPLRRHLVWHLRPPLSLEAMGEAAGALIGRQDFSTFGSPPDGDNAVRTVLRAEWQIVDDEWWFTIQADAFLYRMVRRIVASLVEVGQGRRSPAEFREALAAKNPALAAAAAPACGLTLMDVEY